MRNTLDIIIEHVDGRNWNLDKIILAEAGPVNRTT